MTEENAPISSSDNIIAHIDSVGDRITREMVTRLIELDNGIEANKRLINERIGLETRILEEFVSMYERFLASGIIKSEDTRTAEKAKDYSRHFTRSLANLGVLIESLEVGDIVNDSNIHRVEIEYTQRGPLDSTPGQIFEILSPHSYTYNGKVFKAQKVSIYEG